MKASLGLIFMTLLVHVHSKKGGLLQQPDDRASVRIEVESQRLDENMTSSLKDTRSQLLEKVLQNQAAIMTSQAQILRSLADVKQTLSQRCNVGVTTSDVTATTSSSVVPVTSASDIPILADGERDVTSNGVHSAFIVESLLTMHAFTDNGIS